MGRRTRRSRTNGGHGWSRLARLGSRGKIARRRAACRARGASTALRPNSVVKDPVSRSSGLWAGRALRARARIGRGDIWVCRRAGSCRFATLGDATNAVKGQRGGATEAGRATGSRGTGAHIAVLINIAALLSERSFAIQGAALPSNEVTRLLLGHVLAVIVVIIIVAGNRDFSQSISLVLLLRVEVSKLSLPLGRHPSLGLHDLLCLVGAARGLVALRSIEVV
jgi:hypothetical protein